MHKKGMLLFALILAVALALGAHAIFTGTTEGYARFMDNTVVVNANITVTVAGCSGDGCSRNTTTDANGYYVVANLNLDSGGSVSGFGQWNGANGTNSSTADSFKAAFVNITICRPPATPVIADQLPTHANSTNFNWTSGADPLSLTTYDNLTYDGVETTRAGQQYTQTGINASSNTTHSWNVRTCNALCCSRRANDTFVAVNDPPATPSLTAVSDSHDQNATFYWTNFSDPDGDSTYNEFRIDNGTISNVTSPQNRTGLSFANHTWEVRTCDSRGGCSAFASDTFAVGNTAPSTPNLTLHSASSSTLLTFEWVSGADSDGDAIRNEITVSNDSGYSYILLNRTNQTSPVTISNATSFQTVYWRVRTCDALGSCSAFASDQFVTYACTGDDSDDGAGGGGGSCECQNECEAGVEYCSGNARVVCGNFDSDECTDKKTIACEGTDRCVEGECVLPCTPRWLCTDWSSCGASTPAQSRVCSDINVCGATTGRPPQERSCLLSGLSPEQQKEIEEQQPFTFLGVQLPGTIDIPVKTLVQPLSTPVGAAAALVMAAMAFAAMMFRVELVKALKSVIDWFERFNK